MNNDSKLIDLKVIVFISLISLLIFSFKWFFSYFFFEDDLSLKIILDTPTDGYFYYVYLDALSSLDFNKSFDANIDNLKNLPVPFYSILAPSILFNLFGASSILILELICIFLFLFIFSLIFKKFGISNINSIFFSILLFSIPTLINFLNLDTIQYANNFNDIFNLRFPRPLVTNIFFYLFIFYLICIEKKNFFNFKNFIILGVLLSLSFSSFYYFFFIELISFIFLLLRYNALKKIFHIDKFKYYFISLILFIIFSIPFMYFLLTSEPDYMERMFLIDLSFEKKIILIKHLLNKILSIKFLIIFLIISFLNYLNNLKKFKNLDKINIFYFIFLSSILSPFIFILFSSKTGIISHFTKLVIITAFFYIFFFLINLFLNNFKFKFFFNKNLILLFILILIFFNNLNIYKSFKNKSLDNNYVEYRAGLQNSIQLIKNIDPLNTSLLTFDPRLMVWAIMNDVKHIKLLSGQLVPKTHSMIEDDLIKNFKLLSLDSKDFLEFFKNSKSDWRLLNKNTQLFFWGRYSASSLGTFNGSNNFEKDEIDFIKKISPLLVQSIAIPKEEFRRLKQKFENLNNIDSNTIDIVVLDQRNQILKRAKLKNNFYCNDFSTKNIKIFLNLNHKKECKKIY